MKTAEVLENQIRTGSGESVETKCAQSVILLEIYKKVSESKKEIDFKKLRDEFFAECTELHTEFEGGKVFTKRVTTYAPHDLFEWFKNKIQ